MAQGQGTHCEMLWEDTSPGGMAGKELAWRTDRVPESSVGVSGRVRQTQVGVGVGFGALSSHNHFV